MVFTCVPLNNTDDNGMYTFETLMSQPLVFGDVPLVVVWSPYTWTSESKKSHWAGALLELVPLGFVHTAFVVCPAGAAAQVSPGELGVKVIKENVVPGDGSGRDAGSQVSSIVI
jgi:hypothetical protein